MTPTPYSPTPTFPDLEAKLREAVERVKAMSPAERQAMYEAQRRSFIRAEASFGSDEDERAYSRAVAHGDEAEIARLEAEASARMDAVDRYLAGAVKECEGQG